MTTKEKPAEVVLNGLSEISLQLGICNTEASAERRSQQERARASEIASRRHHLNARRCGGSLSRTELALAEHFGRVARLNMAGVR